MNKKDREQFEINNLLKECIDEQKAIGLNPADGIEIYIQKDPITGYSCSYKIYGLAKISSNKKRKVILIRRKCFDKYPKSELKNLIHKNFSRRKPTTFRWWEEVLLSLILDIFLNCSGGNLAYTAYKIAI